MSTTKPPRPMRSRRTFLTIAGATGAAALIGWRPQPALAEGAQLPHLSESDPMAKALMYTEDSSKVDKSKAPTFKAGSKCSNCNFYQGTQGQAYGPCQLFAGKSVNANGWCASYSPKAS